MKKQGVPDQILNAMLNAAGNAGNPTPQDCGQSFDAALRWLGSADVVAKIQSMRWTGQEVSESKSGRTTLHVERVSLLPSSMYISLGLPNGQITKAVYTPEFNYMTYGKMTTAIPGPTLSEIQASAALEPIHVYQNRAAYSCVMGPQERIGGVDASTLQIQGDGVEGKWNIDPATGRLLRITSPSSGPGPLITDLSDWRPIGGINFPFTRHSSNGSTTNDITIDNLELNAELEPTLFQRPANQPQEALTLKVLQSESVPYVIQTGGGISTTCNIAGSTNTVANASTYGNNTFGTANSNTNLQMNCASRDTTVRWTHVLNAMFVEASDGNAYIIACDRAWAWSKCKPLRSGDTFLARRSDKGFVVQSISSKSKEEEATYTVLQSKSLKQ